MVGSLREMARALLSFAETQKLLDELPREQQKLVQDLIPAQFSVGGVQRVLQALLADPEGAIQRGLNERYSSDLRQRELEHHALWDAEVVVHKMAAARWMRSCVLDVVTDEGVRAAIEALPLVPEL